MNRPAETLKLKELVKRIARYEAYPSLRDPAGLKFTPVPYEVQCWFCMKYFQFSFGIFCEHCVNAIELPVVKH